MAPDSGKVSVILPVYNQEDHLQAIVSAYASALDARASDAGHPYELILVPNGCRDASEEICDHLAAKHPHVRVVASTTSGWGAAVRRGLAAADGDYLCFTNLARTTPEDLITSVNAIRAHPDCVIKADRPLRENRWRRLGSTLYNVEANALFGVRVRDVNGTPKAFPRRFAALLDLRSDGDLLDLELDAVCARNRYPILPLPITSTARHGGTSTTRLGSAVRMYVGALRLRGELWRRNAD